MTTSGSGTAGPPTYTSAEECEAAFYEAFRAGDLGLMKTVWGTNGGIICIHPGRSPLAGPRAVLQSWSEILGSTGGVRVRFDCRDRIHEGSVAVHLGLEIIGAEGEEPATVTVTNIYELTPDGWKMRAHHAAPVRPAIARTGSLH